MNYLESLDAAFKSLTVSDLGDSVLTDKKFEKFIEIIQEKNVLLKLAKFIDMTSQVVHIDRTGFGGRVLRAGADAQGDHRDLTDGDKAKPDFFTNKLVAKELVAVTGLYDTSLKRNIERGNFEDTLVELFAQRAGLDLEEFALLADTDISYGTDDVLSLTDGWIKKAGKKLYSGDFDYSTDGIEAVFEAAINAIDHKYIRNRANWIIATGFNEENEYRDKLKARGTSLGDSAQTSNQHLSYKGFPIVVVPHLSGKEIVMLTNPENMVWGVFDRVTIEKDRIPKARKTDFVLTFEGDAHYEDENAVVVAKINEAQPE